MEPPPETLAVIIRKGKQDTQKMNPKDPISKIDVPSTHLILLQPILSINYVSNQQSQWYTSRREETARRKPRLDFFLTNLPTISIIYYDPGILDRLKTSFEFWDSKRNIGSLWYYYPKGITVLENSIGI